MMLRGARKYDPQTDSIVFATNHPFTMDNYVRAGLGNADLFRFCRRMTNMKVDNAEFALMTAIDIFSERYGLQVSSICGLFNVRTFTWCPKYGAKYTQLQRKGNLLLIIILSISRA